MQVSFYQVYILLFSAYFPSIQCKFNCFDPLRFFGSKQLLAYFPGFQYIFHIASATLIDSMQSVWIIVSAFSRFPVKFFRRKKILCLPMFSVNLPMFSVYFPMFSVYLPMFSVNLPMFSMPLLYFQFIFPVQVSILQCILQVSSADILLVYPGRGGCLFRGEAFLFFYWFFPANNNGKYIPDWNYFYRPLLLLLFDDNKVKMTRKPGKKRKKNPVRSTEEGKIWKGNKRRVQRR